MVEMYDKKLGECMDNEEFKQWIIPETEEEIVMRSRYEVMKSNREAKEKSCASGLKDSGARSSFATGAVRDLQIGKGRMDLLPIRALMAVADIMERGALKYEARNWERGIPLSRFVDSGQRHLYKWLIGRRDEPHLAQACWNFMCLLDTQLRIEEGVLEDSLNDLPCNPIPESWSEDDGIDDDLFGDNWEDPIG